MSRDTLALIACIEAQSQRAFGWRDGRDCVSFAAACIEAQTGCDPLDGIPRWRTKAEALTIARDRGGLKRALNKRLRRIAPAMAQRGDIAGLPDRLFGVRLMVVEGATLVGPGTTGLERLPRSEMVLAWSAVTERADG
jgi:hypothetical protein